MEEVNKEEINNTENNTTKNKFKNSKFLKNFGWIIIALVVNVIMATSVILQTTIYKHHNPYDLGFSLTSEPQFYYEFETTDLLMYTFKSVEIVSFILPLISIALGLIFDSSFNKKVSSKKKLFIFIAYVIMIIFTSFAISKICTQSVIY